MITGSRTAGPKPTACKLAILLKHKALCTEMRALVKSLRAKGSEFRTVIKMGRTQLQDAVPMTLGQEFNSWANSMAADVATVEARGAELMKVNMGGTAIGTGICANERFGSECVAALSGISGFDFVLADDLIEASRGCSAFWSSINSPRLLSSSSPTGVSKEIGSLEIFKTFLTLSNGIANFFASSSGVGSLPCWLKICRDVLTNLLIVSIICTGILMVLA